MKWIGQHIYDLVARFRNDVYLEDISSGTIASGGYLGLDSNNKIVKSASEGDITGITLTAGTGVDLTSVSGATGGAYAATIGVDVSDFMSSGSARRILTSTGTDAMQGEQYLTFANTGNVSTLTLVSNEDTGDFFQIQTTSAGATTFFSQDDDDEVSASLTMDIEGVITTQAEGGVKIENASTVGTAALLIDNDATGQNALKIDAENTTETVVFVDASPMTTGKAMHIQCNTLSTGKGLYLDINDGLTGAYTRNLIELDYDKTGVTADSTTLSTTGLDIDLTNSAANHAGSVVTQKGGRINVTTTDRSGTFTNSGLEISATGGDTNTGITTEVTDGGLDFKAISSADNGDYFSIGTTTHGATTLTTVDDDAAAAHFEIAADGDIILDSAGQIKLEPVAGNNILLDGTVTVDGGSVTGITTLGVDSVSLTAIQTSSESFADNDTSLMTSAAINDRFNLIAGSTSIVTLGTVTEGVWNSDVIASAYMEAASATAKGAVELATTGEADTGTDTARAVTPAGLKSHVDARYSYQYITFSFKANNVGPDLWRSPSQNGPEYYLWDNNHGSGVTQAASDAPKDVDINTTISVDYLDLTTGFIIPKACKIDGFYGNCRVNGTNPNTLRPVLGLFRAAEPADGNTSDLTATCVAFDSYDTASGNRKNRFLKLETSGLNTDLAQGDLLFPAVGFDATASDSAGDIWGSFTIVLKTLIP
jgi:hypothetical protein